MKRRSSLGIIAAVLTASPFQFPLEPNRTLHAADLPVVGLIADADESSLMYRAAVDALREALERRGWSDGESYELKAEYTDGYIEHVDKRLEALFAMDSRVIVSMSNDATVAAAGAEKPVPVVMAPGFDAEAVGLVDDLSHPRGWVTGVSIPNSELWARKVEILRELIPDLQQVGVMGDVYTEDGRTRLAMAVDTVRSLGLEVRSYEWSRSGDILPALTDAAENQVQAVLLVEGQELVDKNRTNIAWHAVSNGLPTMATGRDFAEDGILFSIGPSRAELQEHVADFVAAILDGTTVAELPVRKVGMDALTINARTQKDLSLVVPDTLMSDAIFVE